MNSLSRGTTRTHLTFSLTPGLAGYLLSHPLETLGNPFSSRLKPLATHPHNLVIRILHPLFTPSISEDFTLATVSFPKAKSTIIARDLGIVRGRRHVPSL